MQAMLLIARWGLAAVFALAAVAKLADRAGARRSLADFGVPTALAPFGAVLLPVAELICACALIPSRTAWWGALGVLALLGLFILAIGINLLLGRTPDCQCFGQLESAPIGTRTLARNVVLAAVAVAVLWSGPTGGESAVLPVTAASDGGSMWPVIALINSGVSALLLLALFHVLRQNGRILLRLDAVEARLGADDSTSPAPAGLPVGEVAPNFSLQSLDDATVTLDTMAEAGKRIVLVFSEPACSACDELLPDVARWQRAFADRVSTLVISRGTVGQNRNKRAQYDVQTVVLQRNRETATAYGVEATPSAVLIVDAKIASPLAVGPDAIRRLVDGATQVVRGDRVPSLRLTDVHGTVIDLSQPTGQVHILLFWNPACGYCQELLPEVRRWERDKAPDGAVLRVISTGSVDANIEQGFASQVLLDSRFEAGTAFGASGTPAAVAIDEAGLVASAVSVGAPDVAALLKRVSGAARR